MKFRILIRSLFSSLNFMEVLYETSKIAEWQILSRVMLYLLKDQYRLQNLINIMWYIFFQSRRWTDNSTYCILAGVSTPQYNSRCDSRPKIYVVDVPVPWIDWDTELMILETYNTSGGLASLTSCLDQVTAFFIVSSKLLPDKILSHERLLRYYYIRGSIKEHSQSESGSKGQDRVTSIDSTDYLVGRLYGDLAQYYRDRAQDALFENQNRTEAKYFLTKSEKCFKILESGILKTLKHYNDLSKS